MGSGCFHGVEAVSGRKLLHIRVLLTAPVLSYLEVTLIIWFR